MGKFIFPNRGTKEWKQPNIGDLFGDFWATFNIDLKTERGKILTSRRLGVISDSDDDAQLIRPTGLVRSKASGTDQWWALCHTVVFKTSGTDPTSSYAQDSNTNSPTGLNYLYSDIEDWEGDLIVTYSQDIDRLSGGTTWTNDWWNGASNLNQTGLTANIYHPVKKIFNGLLLIGDDKYVHTVRKDDAGNFFVSYKRLIFPSEFRVVWIKTSNGRAWIGCTNRFGGEGVVFEWNGEDENYTFPSPYKIGHATNLAGTIKDDIPYCINGQGIIMRFTGSGFVEYARLPVANGGIMDDSGAIEINWNDGATVNAMVHPNGMEVVEGEIHILLNAAIAGFKPRILENFAGGIWVVNEGSAYHKYSLNQVKPGETQLDFGGQVIDTAGFLKATYTKDKLVCGARMYKDNATTPLDAIFEITPAPPGNRSYFTTPKIQVDEIEDLWKSIWLKFRKLEDSNDRIIVKYRTEEDHALDFRATGSWGSTTTFVSTKANISNVVDGDEMEVLVGRGAGALVHVLGTPALDGGTYTVTIDEAIANVSGTTVVRFRNWTKIKTISSQAIKNQFVKIGKQAQWIQFKIELRSDMNSGERGVLLDEFIAISELAKSANK